MGFEELRTKLEWFAEEKGRLENAEDAVRTVRSHTENIQFNVPADTNLAEVKAAYDDVRLAVLDDANVSLGAGCNLLDSLATAIGLTGKNYLTMESQNTDYASLIQLLIHQKGL